MLIRQVPKDINNYVFVRNKVVNNLLQKFGCKPMYHANNGFYYKKTNMLLKTIYKISKGGGDN